MLQVSLSELYDRYLDAALAGSCEDPQAFLARHGRASDSLLERLGSLQKLAVCGAIRRTPALQQGRLGPFRILRQLGGGGMGEIYLAEWDRDARLVALKVMRTAIRDAPDGLERFAREARAAAQLDHPHIVRVLDSGSVDDLLYLAMELIPGRDLSQVLREQGSVPPDQALVWMAAIARALSFAHERGVIHRDVKPSNILIRDDGQPVLIDFGLARDATGELSTITRSFVGTPGYAAPEQALGSCDVRSDVYSLGVTLYRCLSGALPFGLETEHDLDSVVSRRPPALPLQSTPQGLETVLARAMAGDPRARFQDASQLAAALEAVLAGD